jgi:hypothetical protein
MLESKKARKLIMKILIEEYDYNIAMHIRTSRQAKSFKKAEAFSRNYC